MARSILASGGSIYKNLAGFVFQSASDLPNPALDINPALWAYTNGQVMDRLTDSSGNNLDFRQVNSGNTATFKTNAINGLPAILFGGNQFYISTADVVAHTIFIVCKNDASTIATNQSSIFNAALPSNLYFVGGPSAYFGDDWNNISANCFGNTTNNPYSKIFVNSGEVPVSLVTRKVFYTMMTLDIIPNTNISIIGASIGGLATTQSFKGEIARMIVYKERLTTTQRNTKMTELLTTYGL